MHIRSLDNSSKKHKIFKYGFNLFLSSLKLCRLLSLLLMFLVYFANIMDPDQSDLVHIICLQDKI